MEEVFGRIKAIEKYGRVLRRELEVALSVAEEEDAPLSIRVDIEGARNLAAQSIQTLERAKNHCEKLIPTPTETTKEESSPP